MGLLSTSREKIYYMVERIISKLKTYKGLEKAKEVYKPFL